LCCSTRITFCPLDKDQRWNLGVNAASAFVDYLPGGSNRANWLNGVGGWYFLSPRRSDRFKIMLDYAYGVDPSGRTGRGRA